LIRWGRSRANWWVALVLPGLLLRALIPLGFMPNFGPDFSVRLTLCDGYAPVPSMAMDMSMDMPMGALTDAPGTGIPSHQEHGTCPYGASPTLAALPALTAVSQTVQVSATSLISSPQVDYFELSARAQSPRGPPLQV
jgi:hypothetical protein